MKPGTKSKKTLIIGIIIFAIILGVVIFTKTSKSSKGPGMGQPPQGQMGEPPSGGPMPSGGARPSGGPPPQGNQGNN